jgi:catechol 2,3-dioxygenase-like lactoylglutathione lyase family enzyme
MSTQDHPPRLLGLWHVALRVKSLAVSRAFYQDIIGMQVVWEPDVDNLYLSLGSDNLALHVSPERSSGPMQTSSPSSSLDHIGFIAASKEDVDLMAKRMEQFGVPIVQPIRCHRDGSYSFYIDDPDGNHVQILYEPHIALQENPCCP